MDWHVYFPIAQQLINPFVLLGMGCMGGFVSSLLGIGSGIIVTPCLMLIGVPPYVAVASQLHNSIGTNFMGFLAYWRQRDVDFALAWYIFCGGFLGAIAEIFFLRYLWGETHDSTQTSILYVVVLGILGTVLLIQNIRSFLRPPTISKNAMMHSWMIYIPLHRIFTRSRVEMSILVPIMVGFLTGLFTSTLGGGNSVFIMPFVTYLIGRATPVVAGTSLIAGCLITIAVTLVHAASSSVGDMLMVWILIFGSFIGTQIGVRTRYRMPSFVIGFAGSIFILAIFLYCGAHLKRYGTILTPIDWAITPSTLPVLNALMQWILDFSIHAPILYGFMGIGIVLFFGYAFERLTRFFGRVSFSQHTVRS